MPCSRKALAGAIIAVAAAGCAPASPRGFDGSSSSAAAQDPDRWERSACLRGEYPPDLDEHAYARARLDDLRAKRNEEWSKFEAARLLDRRREFSARCEEWRRETAPGPVAAKPSTR